MSEHDKNRAHMLAVYGEHGAAFYDEISSRLTRLYAGEAKETLSPDEFKRALIDALPMEDFIETGVDQDPDDPHKFWLWSRPRKKPLKRVVTPINAPDTSDD